jgi:hypothetical protein
MNSIEDGIGPTLYVYAGESSLDDLISEIEEKGEKKIFLSQSDLWKLSEDIQKYVPDFKCFSVLQVSDYLEVEDGEEMLANQFTRNETKFIIRGGILEIEVYNG